MAVGIIACGNLLEWYDFAAYGYLATVLTGLFFPQSDRFAALIQVFAVFAVGYFARIAGGTFYGLLSDRLGRLRALRLSVVLMAGSTTLMGLLPTHAQIGGMAAVLLTLLRLLQGISVGGEFATSLTLLIERTPKRRRGYVASWVGLAASGGFLLGSAFCGALSGWLNAEQMAAWGWRVPFLCGSLLGLGAILARRLLQLDELPAAAGTERFGPLREALRHHRGAMALTVAGTALYMVSFYVPFVYLATGIQHQSHFSLALALRLTSLALLAQIVLTPPAGWLADRVGIRRMLLWTAGATLVLSVPLFVQVSYNEPVRDLLVLLVFVVLYVPLNAVAQIPLVNLFPQALRGTAFSLSFNIAAALFGGLSPLIATWLVGTFHNNDAPSLMLVASAVMSGLAWWMCPDD